MGAVEERQDARADGDFKRAFGLSLDILNRKGSKRLIYTEIEETICDLRALGRENLLPPNFNSYSCYGQRELLNNVKLTE